MMNDVMLRNREIQDRVRQTYAEGAQIAKGLCCPKEMPPEFTTHIPTDAFAHAYGCGSPMLKAGVREGDVVVDLGCGVGIDCFVAAKLVGPTGRVVGIDMTDEMLSRAYSFNSKVTQNLGYEVTEFRKGMIEKLPLEDNSIDLLVSNCVVNLSTDKQQVFREIFRVLRHGGRMVLSDVVSDREIRPEDTLDAEEWAECTVGTLSLQAFLGNIKAAGFVGLTQLEEQPWREIKGYQLGSVTVEANKFETDCHAEVSHLAIYLGPYAEVKDDLGNVFGRFKPVAIRDDVAFFLKKGRNADGFILIAGRPVSRARPAKEERQASPCCNPSDKAAPCCDNNEPKADGSPCCDPYAAQQPADCPCSATEDPPPSVQAQPSACCDGSTGCGPSAGCGTDQSVAVSSSQLAGKGETECCECETEAKATGTECCDTGCGTCGCS